MLQSFEFNDVITHYKPIRKKDGYDFKPSYVEFILEKPIKFLTSHKTMYLVMGKKLNLTSNDMELLDRLEISYNRISVPVYFETDRLFCDINHEFEFIMTENRLTGNLKYSVHNFRLLIN